MSDSKGNMKNGKVPVNVLERSVLKQIRTKRREVADGAGIGKDCAIFAFPGAERVFSCMQEAVFAESGDSFLTMEELIQKCANNLAAGGSVPVAVAITLLLPRGVEEPYIRALMTDAEKKCRELSLQIAGGQTRVTAEVASPVAVVAGYGYASWEDGILDGAVPGQDVVLSKWIGLQGTAFVAKRNHQKLLERYPAYLVEEAEGFGRYLSVLPEAAVALKAGVSAMHDASEGGIFGALWELAEREGVGLSIDLRKLPLRQETVEVCEYCNINPYELMSGGCLVMTTRDGLGLKTALEAAGIPAVIVGKVTKGNDRILINGDEIRYMEKPQNDGIYMVM